MPGPTPSDLAQSFPPGYGIEMAGENAERRATALHRSDGSSFREPWTGGRKKAAHRSAAGDRGNWQRIAGTSATCWLPSYAAGSCAALRSNEQIVTGVYGNRTHRELCSNPPAVLKTVAPTRGANTPEPCFSTTSAEILRCFDSIAVATGSLPARGPIRRALPR